MELLKQPQYAPYPLHHQVMLLFAGTRGYMDKAAVKNVGRWSRDFLRYMDTAQPHVGKAITDSLDFSAQTEEALKQSLNDFNASWSG